MAFDLSTAKPVPDQNTGLAAPRPKFDLSTARPVSDSEEARVESTVNPNLQQVGLAPIRLADAKPVPVDNRPGFLGDVVDTGDVLGNTFQGAVGQGLVGIGLTARTSQQTRLAGMEKALASPDVKAALAKGEEIYSKDAGTIIAPEGSKSPYATKFWAEYRDLKQKQADSDNFKQQNLAERLGQSAVDASELGLSNVSPDFKDSTAYSVAEVTGQLLPYLAGPIAAPLGIGQAEKQQYDDYMETMKAQGKQPTQEGQMRALGLGALTGIPDALPVMSAMHRFSELAKVLPEGTQKRLAKLAESKLANILAKAKGKPAEVAQTAIEEGVTEFGQQMGQNLIAQTGYDPNRDLTQGAVEAGAIGAGAGASLAAIMSLLTPGRPHGLRTPPPATNGNNVAPTATGPGSALDGRPDANAILRDAEVAPVGLSVDTTQNAVPSEPSQTSDQPVTPVGLAPQAPSPVTRPAMLSMDEVAHQQAAESLRQTNQEKGLGLTDHQIEEIAQTRGARKEMGWHVAKAGEDKQNHELRAVVQRAVDFAGQGGNSHYFSLDFSNLGGLNAHFRDVASKTNAHFVPMMDMVKQEVSKVDPNATYLRTGGDEFGGVTQNGSEADIQAAIDAARQRIRQYAKDNGFDKIEHGKTHQKNFGVDLYYGIEHVDPSRSAQDIIDLADTKMGQMKQQVKGEHENVGRTPLRALGRKPLTPRNGRGENSLLPEQGGRDSSATAEPEGGTGTPAPEQPAGLTAPAPTETPAVAGVSVSMQPRARDRLASIDQMQDIARNPDPGRLTFSRSPNTGAPMVSVASIDSIPAGQRGETDHVTMADGRKIPVTYAVVEADSVAASHDANGNVNAGYDKSDRKALNNGRTAGIQEAYRRGTAQPYRDGLGADSKLTGISPEAIASLKNPMLVRLYDAKENTADIGAQSNVSDQLGMSATEQAKSDAHSLPPLDGIQFNKDGAIPTRLNADYYRAWFKTLGKNESASLMDANGQPNADAVRRLQAAIVAKAYGDDRLLTAFAEEVNPDNRNILTSLVRAAPAFAKVEDTQIAHDVKSALIDAFDVVREASARDMTVTDFVAQGDLLGRNEVADAVAVFMDANKRSVTRMATAYQGMAEYVEMADRHAATGDIFGEVLTPTVEGALRAGNQKLRDEYGDERQIPEPRIASVEVRHGQSEPDGRGRAETGDAETAGPEGAQEETLKLTQQTEAERAAEEAANKAAEEAERKKREAAEQKAEADSEANDFRLSGSDRPADVAAAGGQSNLFDAENTTSNKPDATTAWDAMSVDERTALMLEDGSKWRTKDGNAVNVPGRALMRKSWADLPDTARTTLESMIQNRATEEHANQGSASSFTSGMSPMQAGKAEASLNKLVRFSDGVKTIREHIDGLHTKGALELETFDEPRIKPMSRTRFNRASQREQDAHEKKMKEAGNKTVYLVSGSDLGKTAYDYARYLQNSESVSHGDTTEQKSGKPTAKSAKTQQIGDFGEKLEGARKDLAIKLGQKLTDDEVASQPLSKIWPQSEIDAIDDNQMAAFATAARSLIPSKPRDKQRLKRWVERVQQLREITANELIGKSDRPELEKSRVLQDFFNKVDLLAKIDRSQWSRIGEVRDHSGAIRHGEDGEVISVPSFKVEIDGKWHRAEGAKTLEDAAASVKKALEKGAPEKALKFEIRQSTKTGKYFINKSGDKEYTRLKEFDKLEDARNFLKNNHAELVAAWELVKVHKNVTENDVRGKVNRIREGMDYRQGKDVTPEQFADAFGFRGVQFGNWVGQGKGGKERQGMLNQAYDALMDLANVTGLPPKSLSLNGSLGLAFGARGGGNKASAHFEPDTIVINLTKTKGAGSLAHEWFHALDNYFSRMRGEEVQAIDQDTYRRGNYITYRPDAAWVRQYDGAMGRMRVENATSEKLRVRLQRDGKWNADKTLDENATAAGWKRDPNHRGGVRPQMEAAFAELVTALNNSPMAERARRIDKKDDAYWSRIIERAARSFENYVIGKLDEKGIHNDFLANVTPVDEFARDADRYPYLKPEELKPVAEAFDTLFNTIETKEGDNGNVALFHRNGTTSQTGTNSVEYKDGQKILESRLEQWLASVNPDGRGRIGLVGSEWTQPSRYKAEFGRKNPFLAEGERETTPDEGRVEQERLIAAAKEHGFFIDRNSPLVDDILAHKNQGGEEHDAYTVGHAPNRIVIRSTLPHKFGHIDSHSPASYLRRLQEYNQTFPNLQMRVIGVSQEADGSALIWTAQTFVHGKEYPNQQALNAAMQQHGWYPLGIHEKGSVRFRNDATGAIISDVHPGNVLHIGDELFPIDVIVEKLPESASEQKPSLARSVVRSGRSLPVKNVEVIVRRIVQGDAERGGIAVPHVVPDFDSLPPDVLAAAKKEGAKAGDIKGLHWRGQSYILADQMHSAADVEETVYHEHYTHGGLRAKYGEELQPLLAKLVKANGGLVGIRMRASKQGINLRAYEEALSKDKKLTTDQKMNVLMEELMAHMSKTTGTLRRMIEEWVGAVRDFLRRNGFAKLADYGVTDLAHIMKQAREAAKGVKSGSGRMMFQRAFHGSPHRGIEHEGFKLNKIGTGEGAQAYGWGIYFASRREIGESYRASTARPEVEIGGRRFKADGGGTYRDENNIPLGSTQKQAYEDASRGLYGSKAGQSVTSLAEEAESYLQSRSWMTNERIAEAKKAILNGEVKLINEGQLYSAEIPGDNDLLDWDKPLSEQPEKVRAALERAGIVNFAENIGPSPTGEIRNLGWAKNVASLRGEEIYRRLIEREFTVDKGATTEARKGSERAASQALLAAGIPGLRYLDGDSRSKGEGTHNYVIWDESLLTPDAAKITPLYQRAPDDELTAHLIAQYANEQGAPTAEQIREAVKQRRQVEADNKAVLDAYDKDPENNPLPAPNGKPSKLNRTQWVLTRTPNFKHWFGDWENDPDSASKVVDENGEPLVVYHGSGSQGIEVFDGRKAGSVKTSDWGKGVYFTPSRWQADGYRKDAAVSQDSEDRRLWSEYEAAAKRMGTDPMNAAIDLGYGSKKYRELGEYADRWRKNREAIRKQGDRGEVYAAYLRMKNPLRYRYEGLTDPYLAEQAKQKGHDGVIIEHDDGSIDEIVVFDPNQIKSAIGNTGQFGPTDNIMFSKRNLSQEQEEALSHIGAAPQSGSLSDRIHRLTDRFGEKFTQNVIDQFSPLKSLDMTSYMQARLSKGTDGALEATLLYGTPHLRDGAYDVNMDGGFANVLAELQGDHDNFLAWVAGNRSEQLAKEGREHLFNATQIDALKSLNQGTMPDGTSRAKAYDKALDGLRKYQNAILDIAEQAGLIDKAERSNWYNDFYVPFYRELDPSDGKSPYVASSSQLVKQRAFQTLKGGDAPLKDLLENVLGNWSHLLTASMRNMAGVKALTAAEKAGIARKVQTAEKGSIWVMENGKQVHYMVSDPLVLDALTALNYEGLKGPTWDAIRAFKHALTTGVTLSPTFRVRNLIRDTLTTLAISDDAGWNPVGNIITGWNATKKGSQTEAIMLMSGGKIHFGAFNDGDQARNAQRLIDERIIPDHSRILTNPHAAKRALSRLWDWYQETGDRSETINRAVVYQNAIKAGKTHLEASYEARNLLDFTMTGKSAAIRALTSSVSFANARIQGMYRLYTGARANPIRFGAMTGAVALASIVLYAIQRDDDDYKALPDWVRDTYWPVKVDDKFYYIPKPFEIGALGSVAERSFELAMGGNDYQARDFGKSVVSIAMDQLSMNPVPQAFSPALQAIFDRDLFRGQSIDTFSESTNNVDPKNRYSATTSAGAVAVGRALDVSPRKVEFLVRGYLGWLGVQALNVSDLMMRRQMGMSANPNRDLTDIHNIFAIGDFVQKSSGAQSKYVDRFYQTQADINRSYADNKLYAERGQDEEYKRSFGDPNLAIRGSFNQQARAMTKLNATRRRILFDPNMTAEEKNKAASDIYQQMKTITLRADAQYRDFVKKQSEKQQ